MRKIDFTQPLKIERTRSPPVYFEVLRFCSAPSAQDDEAPRKPAHIARG
ncbi:hypothetical protein WKW80_31290 [Variovorax humicola]|uniref:Uncharacterized protein n=1 Tax=Variovorax humicola TaxID=1769758 RepID=A0ABU8W8T8_9BURK